MIECEAYAQLLPLWYTGWSKIWGLRRASSGEYGDESLEPASTID